MLAWQEQLLSSIGSDTDQHDTFKRITDVAQTLGFEYVCYRVCITLPPEMIKGASIENYPKRWSRRYSEQNYLKVDPTIGWAMKEHAPLLWNDSYTSAPAYWDDARSYGLLHGWTQGTWAGSGVSGIFSLARSSTAISAAERKQDEIEWQWLSRIAHLALMRSVRSALPEQHFRDLTAREIEVLKWSAAGKTYFDVAGILNITHETVKFHLKNAAKKLDCSNKTHAVAHAAFLGLLT